MEIRNATSARHAAGKTGGRPSEGREAASPGWRFTLPLMLGSSLNPINSSIIATTLIAIGHTFHAGAASTIWLVSALYLASAIGQPTMGRLAERLGPRRVFVAGLTLVGIGGALGTVAMNLPTLVAARVILGVGTSAGYPTAMVIVRRWAADHEPARTGGTLGALAIAAQVTSALGLPLGGLLAAAAGWRITFFINVPLVLIGVLMTLAWVPRDLPRAERTGESAPPARLDIPGMVLFSGTIASLLFFLNDLHHPRWGLCALLLVALVLWERRADDPFVDVRMLSRNKPLSATYLRVCLTFLLNYCILYGLTQWLQETRGLSAVGVGLLILPMSVFAALISIPFARRNLVRSALYCTAAAAVIGPAGLLLFTSATPIWVLVLITMVFGVVSGLGVIGNQAALYQQAPAEAVGVAAGLMRTFTYLGAVLSSSLISLSFGARATDSGLHTIIFALLGLGAVLFAITPSGARNLKAS
ncbi:MFS transporter [Streptomyces brasiliensis]|uniref:MFS transporter n=1 Tax=Streptomyces brasiliensis TaxID=1954 RepID=A0A917NZN5_9ACTN|nr:MFS transporter [Streptomyces brasiliensis]GGJ40016.1 MFS transporter [Streptomyces brasiliensis]